VIECHIVLKSSFQYLAIPNPMRTNPKNLCLAFLLLLSAHPAQAADGVPAYQIVAPNGRTSLLVGSMHIAHRAVRQPSQNVLDGARVLIVEHTSTNSTPNPELAPEVLVALMRGEERPRAAWASSLTQSQIARLRTNLNCVAPQPVSTDKFAFLLLTKSALLMSQLAYMPCAPTGMLSRDAIFDEAAQLRGIPTVALETQDAIAARRARMPEQMHVDTLKRGLTSDIDKLYLDLADALNQGKFDAIAAMADGAIDNRSYAALFHQVMVKERNAAWLSSLIAELDRGDAVVIVGAAHLPGKDGLVALLTTNGYRVRPTLLPSGP
jgi:uncharacterized protein YbaP (TraB family)